MNLPLVIVGQWGSLPVHSDGTLCGDTSEGDGRTNDSPARSVRQSYGKEAAKGDLLVGS